MGLSKQDVQSKIGVNQPFLSPENLIAIGLLPLEIDFYENMNGQCQGTIGILIPHMI